MGRVGAWVIDHPSVGTWDPSCLSWQTVELPSLGEGDLLIRPIHLSLDPSNIVWLALDQTYILPLAVGDVNVGMVLAEVQESRAEGFMSGDMVLALAPWSEYAVISTDRELRVPPERLQRISGFPLAVHLTIFSHIGLAAMIGMREVADVQDGETVLISAAAGAVGGLAGQIAKAHGARVVGIAGGAVKCRLIVEELGFDAAIDYRSQDLDAELGRLCPEGVDVYFDNVGGPILDAALLHLADGGRVAVCGQLSQYATPEQQRPGVKNLYELVVRNVRMQGYVPPAFAHRFGAIHAELAELLEVGRISHRPHIVKGWQTMPEALGMLLEGGNAGKLIAQVAPDPWL